MKIRGSLLFLLITCLLVILSGCFKGEQSMENIDPPEDTGAMDQVEESDQNDKDETSGENQEEPEAKETIASELYVMDVNGMVVSQTLELPAPESQEVAKQALEHLVVEGPVTSLLPNGFNAVLPQGTEVLGLDLQEDGTVVVDFSEEFKNYEEENETKILESLTYTLTEFESVDRVKLMINGEPQDEMPVGKTPISEGYSKANGINLLDSDTSDLINSRAVTMYFPAEHNDTRYYVPITKHILSDEESPYQEIVQTLIEGPGYNTNVLQVFNSDTMLIDEPELDNGVLRLVFNQGILKDPEKAVLSDEVMETIVRTLSEQSAVEAVDIQVEDVDKLVNENGEVYDKPVTTELFISKEEL